MSRLAQLWDQCHQFGEDELAFFAETQKRLSQPFLLPQIIPPRAETVDSAKVKEDFDDWIPDSILQFYRELVQRGDLVKTLKVSLKQLSTHLTRLTQAHERVKAKSLLMQSLWDGIAEKQSSYGRLIAGICKHLEPYQRYLALQETTSSPTAIFSKSEYLAALREITNHYNQLTTRQDLDAPLYVQRYLGLLRTTLRSNILPHLQKAFHGATSQAGSRVMRTTISIELLSDINASYLTVVSDISPIFKTLLEIKLALPAEFDEMISPEIQRYYSHRASILHHVYTKLTEVEGSLDHLLGLIRLAFAVGQEERFLAERLFGSHLDNASLKKLVEGFLVPLLAHIKEVHANLTLPPELISEAIVKVTDGYRRINSNSNNAFEGVDEGQRRLCQIFNQYFSTTKSTFLNKE